MLLHSIMGVGTNLFPMEKKKSGALAKLITEDEMAHVQAFPSVLRLLVHGPLLTELQGEMGDVVALDFHRLLDNERISLTREQLWVHLNFQLIHAIDFLPAAAWQHANDYFYQIFVTLHTLLTRNGQLMAKVEYDPSMALPLVPGCRPQSWRHWAVDSLPAWAVMGLASRQIANYSADVGHSLAYELRRTAKAKL